MFGGQNCFGNFICHCLRDIVGQISISCFSQFFLFQMLLLGLILCCGSAVVHALKPNLVVCSVARIASGTSYAIVYATLLVKLVFLVSLNGGVYLPATYQSLLLCFAILIQVSTRPVYMYSSLLQLILGSRDLSYA